jgi:hypothetical protein
MRRSASSSAFGSKSSGNGSVGLCARHQPTSPTRDRVSRYSRGPGESSPPPLASTARHHRLAPRTVYTGRPES